VKRERQEREGAFRGEQPRVDCYLIAFSKASACDEGTGELSLFQLVSRSKHQLSDYGLTRPFTALFCLETTEIKLEIEIRSLWVPRSVNALAEPFEDPVPIVLNSHATQLRYTHFRIPQAPGKYDLMLEWRSVGGKWRRCSARFPVTFE